MPTVWPKKSPKFAPEPLAKGADYRKADSVQDRGEQGVAPQLGGEDVFLRVLLAVAAGAAVRIPGPAAEEPVPVEKDPLLAEESVDVVGQHDGDALSADDREAPRRQAEEAIYVGDVGPDPAEH